MLCFSTHNALLCYKFYDTFLFILQNLNMLLISAIKPQVVYFRHQNTYITRATKISCPYFWVGLELINTAAAFNIASLLHTQKSPNVDEEIAKVVHEGDFACSVDGHAEGGRGQVVEGLQEALSIAGLTLMLQQLVHKVTVLILTTKKILQISALHS